MTQVAAGLIVALLVYLAGTAAGVLPSLLAVSHALWRHLTSPIELPGFLLWLLIGCAGFTALAAFKAYRLGREVRLYKEDSFFGVKAKWRWSVWRLKPVDIRVLCPRCSTRLVTNSQFAMQHHDNIMVPTQKYYSSCEHCNRKVADGGVAYLEDRVERQIERNLDTGDWRKKVAA